MKQLSLEQHDRSALRMICKDLKVNQFELMGKRRFWKFVDARRLWGIYLVKARPDLALKQIGKLIGGRDHSSVIGYRDEYYLVENDYPATYSKVLAHAADSPENFIQEIENETTREAIRKFNYSPQL